jgi:hypothetical protein
LESLSKSLSEKQSLIESVRGSLSMSESRCLAVEQNAAALRLELEVERLGRAAAEKTAMTGLWLFWVLPYFSRNKTKSLREGRHFSCRARKGGFQASIGHCNDEECRRNAPSGDCNVEE